MTQREQLQSPPSPGTHLETANIIRPEVGRQRRIKFFEKHASRCGPDNGLVGSLAVLAYACDEGKVLDHRWILV